MSAIVLTAVERELARREWQDHLAQRPNRTRRGGGNTARGGTLAPRCGDGISRYVIDASVAVEYLLRAPLGLTVANMIESSSFVAPEMLDAEVLSVLRRVVLNGHLEEARAQMVVDDLLRWPVDRISHRFLAPLAWQYHRNISAYDAFYVAAARAEGLPLITADGRLSRASGLGVMVHHVRMV